MSTEGDVAIIRYETRDRQTEHELSTPDHTLVTIQLHGEYSSHYTLSLIHSWCYPTPIKSAIIYLSSDKQFLKYYTNEKVSIIQC